jgi:predicted O-linked N-acetylglucosamine transferase (SPINDLY family)
MLEQAFALHRAGRLDEAKQLYEALLRANPRHADALHLLGVMATQTRFPGQAVGLIERAIAIDGKVADYHLHLGFALIELEQFADALSSFDRAISLGLRSPVVQMARAQAYFNLAIEQTALGQLDQAIASYEQAIEIKPDHAPAFANRGVLLAQVGRLDDAIDSHSQSLRINPGQAQVHANRGNAHFLRKQLPEAAQDFELALKLDPHHDFVAGTLFHANMQMCKWDEADARLAALESAIERGEKVAPPFAILAASASPAIHRKASETWINALHPAKDALGPCEKRERGRDDRIRIAYFSADFHQHATAYLVAELFELHDRHKFEVIAISFGPPSDGPMRARISQAVDQFIDASTMPDRAVAALARELGVDIAVDLKGITQDSRPGIFAHRAAPVQVNYLGYPASMGASYIDYVIADATVIPPGHHQYYAEKVVNLPGSYQVNDRQRAIAEREFTREELGLPPTGFVFCCFNNNYKITPATFASWMRILAAVEGSVLWLLEDHPIAASNLRAHAARHGIAAERLVFAPRMPLDQHLARHRLAGLFLDTLPYNAHTTASDALWAGLPVLTCIGTTFAGRVAASLLHAIGLPELIMASSADYESCAIALAQDAGQLGAVVQKLQRQRLTAPLFNTQLFTRHIEAAYEAMLGQ